MAVSLRLQRHGKNHRPFYHLVATDHRMPRDGRFIEKLGYYDPGTEPSTVKFNVDRLQYWYERGARPSRTVATLLKKTNVTLVRNQKKADAK